MIKKRLRKCLINNFQLQIILFVLINCNELKNINCYKILTPTLQNLSPTSKLNDSKRELINLITTNNDNINNNNSEIIINNQLELNKLITQSTTSSSTTTATKTSNILSDSEIFNRELFDQLTTNNPCLVHYCAKGKECIINVITNEPECICQRYCSHRKRLICGTNGHLYDNHCELHRASCIENKLITYQRMEKCLFKKSQQLSTTPAMTTTTTRPTTKSQIYENLILNKYDKMIKENLLPNSSSSTSTTNYLQQIDVINQLNKEEKQDNKKISSTCTSQEYEIMKDNLLLYNHARLMSNDNNHSKDFLLSIMFSHYDQNNNANLEIIELNQITINEHLNELSNGCLLSDMLNYDDTDFDGKLNINEFYQAFSKLYSVSVVSLDKALEINHLSARVGDNVEIKCDVTGSPLPPLIWQRNNIELMTLKEDDIRIFNDGSLYLTRIQLYHSGNYSCHAQRNKDVVQTHILSVYTTPEVRVMPRIQSKRPGENAIMFCHINGDPFPKVEWLKNDEIINVGQQQHDKYEIIGNGTSLHVKNIIYSDTGAYMCQGRNIGGTVRDISSLIVQEEPTPTVQIDERKFFVFHEYGIAIYEPSSCHLNHQIKSNDFIPGTQLTLCPNNLCSWGRAINVGTHYIYASQPNNHRILIISIIQMVIVDIIQTNEYPVNLYYVSQLDQVWLLCWQLNSTINNHNNDNNDDNDDDVLKNLHVIPNAGKKHHQHITILPENIDNNQSIDLIKNFYIPSNDLEQSHYSFKYGYVTHKNQCHLYKLDLLNLRYIKSIDLTLYNCVPEKLEFSALYGFVIMSCIEPNTKSQHGQLILDYLTDSVLQINSNLYGIQKISPDSRYLVTIQHNRNGVLIVVQKITKNGLEYLFDVKTTLNISDVTFYESQSMHGYDLFASATDKDDILYLNLYTGKVEMITGVGPSMPIDLVKWNNPARLIRSSGLFGQYMITPANNALFIINGKARTVNCEIGGIMHPIAVIWVQNLLPNYNLIVTVETTSIGDITTESTINKKKLNQKQQLQQHLSSIY